MAVIQEKNSSLKLISDKYQVDLMETRQMNAALNGQLGALKLESQRQRDSDSIVAQETNAVLSGQLDNLKAESQRYRDSEDEVKADLRRSSEDLRRTVDDLRAQASLRDADITLEVHEKATNRIKEQGKMIADLTRQATTLAARYKEGKLVSHHLFIHFCLEGNQFRWQTEPEATFVQSLIKKTQALHEQELVSKANDIRRVYKFTLSIARKCSTGLHSQIVNINQNLESKIETMHSEMAKLLDNQV